MTILQNTNIPFDYSPTAGGNDSVINDDTSIDVVDDVIRRLSADTKLAFNDISSKLEPLTKELTPTDLAPNPSNTQVLTVINNKNAWRDPGEISSFRTWGAFDFDYQFPAGAYVDANNISLSTQNTGLGGITSDGTYMYVSDSTRDKIFAYEFDGTHTPERDFDTLSGAGLQTPTGLTNDGTHMWVADRSRRQIYAFEMATSRRVASEDFTTAALTAAGATALWGIHTQNGIMYVLDQTDDQVYAFALHGAKERLEQEEFPALNIRRGIGSSTPRDIWMDDKFLYLLAISPARILVYDLETKLYTGRTIPLPTYTGGTAGAANPYGMWGDGEFFYVADLSDRLIYAVSQFGQLRTPIVANGSNISSVTKLSGRQVRFNFTSNITTDYQVFTSARTVVKRQNNLTLEYGRDATSLQFGVL